MDAVNIDGDTMLVATNASEVVELARSVVSDRLGVMDVSEFSNPDMYWRFRHAWSSITFTVVNDTEVRATTPDPSFGYICASALDVLTSENIFDNGHICTISDRSAVFYLNRKTCGTCA